MSTVEVVHRHVLSALMRGELRPGDWLRQDDIAAELGISKVPVREALQRLAAEGLVTFEANRGTVVRSLTAAGAEEIYELRRALEPLLLRRSVTELTIVDLAEAEWALDDPSLSIGESNWAFHRALYAGAHWDRAVTIVARLHAAVAPYVVLYTLGLEGSSVSDEQHRELLRTCHSRDVAASESVLIRHLDDASTAIVEFLRETGVA